MHSSREEGWLRSLLPPEARLILHCARSQMDDANAAQVRALAQGHLDWGSIHRMAFWNGQMPALYAHLNGLCPEAVPPDTLQCLRAYDQRNLEQNKFHLQTLFALRAKLEAHGVQALPYLESVFSFEVSGPRLLRPCAWIDFVIRAEDARAVRSLLLPLQEWTESPASVDPHIPREKWGSLVFGRGPREIALSFHWMAAPWRHAIAFDLQQIWPRATPGWLAGHALPCPAPEDLLLLHSIQSAEYAWKTLTAVCDVAELLRARPGMDWQRVREDANRTGIRRMLFVALYLAHELLGSDLPDDLAGQVQADRRLPAIAQKICASLFWPSRAPDQTPQTLLFQLRMRERPRDQARYLWRYLTIPTEADWKLPSLPTGFGFLRAWLRSIRLAWSTLRLLLDRPIRLLFPQARRVSGYAPSQMDVVDRMLDLGEVGPDDVVYDLGCGDGRIVIQAAKRFGARGVGIDLDPERIRESRANARREGVEHLVTFLEQDAMTADVSRATVVALYLPTRANLELAPKLLRQLPAGARIVSHNADIGDWDRVEVCEREGSPCLLYLRRVSQTSETGKRLRINSGGQELLRNPKAG